MLSYKIYLTKSPEVAKRISLSFSGEMKTGDMVRVGHGSADGDDRIPAIYHGKGFHYCIVELIENDENGKPYAPTYELTIC